MMFSSSFGLLMALLSFCASTISTPPSPSPILLLSPKYINQLAGPDAPPGFDMRIFIDQVRDYDPVDFYISAVDEMYTLTDRSYEQVIHMGHSEVVRGVQFSYYEQAHHPISMQNKHIVLGILVGISTMAKQQDFSTAFVELRFDKKIFGLVRIGTIQNRGLGNGRKINNIAATAAGPAKELSMTTANLKGNPALRDPATARKQYDAASLNYTSSMTDPLDRNLTFDYGRYGEAMECQTLFGAALDALATSAQHDGNALTDTFMGTDWSNRVVYQAFSLTSAHGDLLLTYELIRRVMVLVPRRIFDEESCGETSFRIVHHGVRMGTGRFWLPDFPEPERADS
ncbi:MAG: hypothetical protein L6R40_007657 [Gallowayella cf. fulva]|nr:MAG: hypothetical protein L6R40_007657 [Xanthomendoza cf. fulva]